jgi:hypothetical protein
VRCQCVGPTIPDSVDVCLALMLIKPALLSHGEIAAPKRATLASRPSVVVRSGGLVLDCTCLSHAGGVAASLSIVEIVVIVPRRRRGRALQDSRREMVRFARGWTLRRIAADLGLKFHEVGEDIGLAP